MIAFGEQEPVVGHHNLLYTKANTTKCSGYKLDTIPAVQWSACLPRTSTHTRAANQFGRSLVATYDNIAD